MRIHETVLELIGNTPLIKLRRASEATGCTILGKCEFLNPGQSVKDRAALYIIRDAMERGELRPGGLAPARAEHKPRNAIGLAEPPGAARFSYYTTGELKAEGSSITEGIGQGRITRNLEGLHVDHAVQIPDEESVPVCFDLLEHE